MKKLIFTAITLLAGSLLSYAQTQPTGTGPSHASAAIQPFLFSVSTLTDEQPHWNLNYSGSYGERVTGPFGYDGVDQQFAVQGYLGNRFTLYANAAFGFARNGQVNSMQQAEVLHDFIGGHKLTGARLGLSLGANRDMSNTAAVFSRITGAYNTAKWRIGGNLRFEKAFNSQRDDIDLVSSIGFQRRIAGNFFAGVEALGQDLEGFWDSEEAEGGARLLVGPSLNYMPSHSRFGFSVCGGPVFYATRSSVIPSEAIREVSQNGYTLRALVTFNLNN